MAVVAGKPRALLVTPDFPPDSGGVQELLHNLVRHSEAFEWHVVTFEPRFRRCTVDDDLSVQRVRRVRPDAAAVLTLNASAIRAALARPPDVLLSGHIAMAPAAHAIRALTRARVVQYVYAMELARRPRFTRWSLRAAGSVVAISRYSASLAESAGADPGRIQVIPPGVDVPSGPPAKGRASKSPRFSPSRAWKTHTRI